MTPAGPRFGRRTGRSTRCTGARVSPSRTRPRRSARGSPPNSAEHAVGSDAGVARRVQHAALRQEPLHPGFGPWRLPASDERFVGDLTLVARRFGVVTARAPSAATRRGSSIRACRPSSRARRGILGSGPCSARNNVRPRPGHRAWCDGGRRSTRAAGCSRAGRRAQPPG
jgi:hypothetical protein